MAGVDLTSALIWAAFWVAAPSFLIGSVPMGLLVARWFGHGDVRQIGSGNIGATNVLRTGDKRAAALTLALDVAKGALPALIAWGFYHWWFSGGPLQTSVSLEASVAAGVAGLAAFLGHCYSPFLNFKGGKGIATGLGALLAWRPEIAGFALLVFVLVVWRTRYVSVASLSASFGALALCILMGSWNRDVAVFGPFVLAMALVTAWRHRENIDRLLKGEESKVSLGGGSK